jgi:hypothetical protein
MTNPSTHSDLISLTDFEQFLFEKLVPLKDLQDFEGKPMEKIFPYWRRHGLLPFVGKGQWLRLSFAQLLWVRILDTLREFSYPQEDTKAVCNYFFKDAYDHNLPEKNLKANQAVLLKKLRAGTITEEERDFLERINRALKDETLLYLLKFDINYLTNLLTDCLASGEEAAILIFRGGRVGELLGGVYSTHSDFAVDPREPHLYLSLTHLLTAYIDSEELSTILMPQLLNDDEKKVLRELRTSNVREINITLSQGEVKRIESTKSGTISSEQAREIKRILGLQNYERITLDTRDEKTLSFKKTSKTII